MNKETEFLDLLDESGAPTGETVGREDAHTKGHLHRVTKVWVINSKGEILLQKRSPNKKSYPNTWAMSCEGHLSAGQSSIEGTVRELKEELGIEVSQDQIQLLSTRRSNAISDTGRISNHFIDIYLLKLDPDVSKLKLQQEELTAVRWMKLDDYIEALESKNPLFRPYDEELEELKSMAGKQPEAAQVFI